MKHFLLLAILASAAQSQTRPTSHTPDSSAVSIMARAGARLELGSTVSAMRRRAGLSRSARDEIADSLLQRAIGPVQPADTGRYNAKYRAMLQLGAAGAVGYGGDDVPYPGAFERLVGVFEQSPDGQIRVAVMYQMLSTPDRPRALTFLRQVATGQDNVAAYAVRTLIRDNRGLAAGMRLSEANRLESGRVLRELLDTHVVVTADAQQELFGWSISPNRVEPKRVE